jgi:hypothetical protein
MPPDPVRADIDAALARARICSVALEVVIRHKRSRQYKKYPEFLGIDEGEIHKTRRADLHFAVAGLRGLPAEIIERRLAILAPPDRDALRQLMAGD